MANRLPQGPNLQFCVYTTSERWHTLINSAILELIGSSGIGGSYRMERASEDYVFSFSSSFAALLFIQTVPGSVLVDG